MSFVATSRSAIETRSLCPRAARHGRSRSTTTHNSSRYYLRARSDYNQFYSTYGIDRLLLDLAGDHPARH